MTNLLSLLIPYLNSTSIVRALLAIVFFAGNISMTIAQSSTPLTARNSVMLLEFEEADSVSFEFDYENEPSSPLTKEDLNTSLEQQNLPATNQGASGTDAYLADSSETIDHQEAEKPFAIEPAATPFEIGKKVDFEGLRVANIDPNGNVILMEDMIEPILYLRFQQLSTGYVEIKVYSENGALIMADKASNLMIGTELQLNFGEWSEGTHSLQIRIDNGTKWTKKIVKTSTFVSNY